jgi:magnesium chelatase subunit D
MSGLPFSAVVGQDEAKLALVMAAARPALGGVLLRGDKGSAKTTLARGLAALLPDGAPFIELPLGASEERVIGSLDLGELLTNGRPRLRPGLLAAAHGGVLYVDEVNLLADHLVDALLDVAVSGVNRVERDGLSHTHPARFVLVASMNPEEGELRPQLLDRFGLSVAIAAPVDAASRVEAVQRQLVLEGGGAGPDGYMASDDEWRQRLRAACQRQVNVPAEVVQVASQLALEVGAEGLRADLMLCRGAAAVAALDGRVAATADDVFQVAGMVLGHRRRRRPFDEPGIEPDELAQAWERASNPRPDDGVPDSDRVDPAGAPGTERLPLVAERSRQSESTGGFATGTAPRGRIVRTQPYDPDSADPVDPAATALALATRRAATSSRATADVIDLRQARHEQRIASCVVFVVDASASMGVERRMAATKACVLGLLGDAYRRRGQVALVTFRGEGAEVVLRPTGSVEIARARLDALHTGGATPLAAGLDTARDLLREEACREAMVVVVTDGRATAGAPDPVEAARLAIHRLAATGARIVVVDTEQGPVRLGLAAELAAEVGAEHQLATLASADQLERAIRPLWAEV